MKILHVLAQLPAKTGSGVYFCNIIQRLQPYGHQQAALFARQDDSAFTLLPGENQYPVSFQCGGVPFAVPGMSDVMPYPSTKYCEMDGEQLACWRAAFLEQLQRARDEFCPDVVVLHHLWMLASLAVDVFPGTILVGVCHNTDLRQAHQCPALKAKYVTNIHRLHRIFALSDAQKGDISGLYGVDAGRIVNVGGGYDEKLFYPPRYKEPHPEVRLVFAAKIDASKGIYTLIDAFRAAQRQKPSLRLDIVGTPNEENAPRLQAAVKGHEAIRLHSAMPQPRLADFLRKADIFVLPSFYEGIALSAIESLACGLFTVATEIEALMALLGPAVNNSGVIQYVPLPRMQTIDQPLPEDLPAFVQRLANALLLQAEKVERGEPFPPEISGTIEGLSWARRAEAINSQLVELFQTGPQ